MTKIMECKCAHEYQDANYGKGNRVHNQGAKVWRCTVCGDEKPRSENKGE